MVSLATNARKIVELSWGVETQRFDMRADIQSQICANDGRGNAPGFAARYRRARRPGRLIRATSPHWAGQAGVS